MHKSQHLATRILTLFFLSIQFHSCMESPEITELETIDKEFLEATQVIDDLIESIDTSTENGRKKKSKWEDSKKSITILKYKKGKKNKPGELQFNTNRDKLKGFTPISEETVTAIVKPGELVFWYAGGGIEELVGIEFVPDAQSELGELPEDLDKNHMWYVWIPKDAKPGELKYDILYRLQEKYRNSESDGPIRLDPKLHVIKKDQGDKDD